MSDQDQTIQIIQIWANLETTVEKLKRLTISPLTNAPQVAMNERQSDVCGAINVNDNFECDNNGGGIENASLQESIERHVRDTLNLIGHSTRNNCNPIFSSLIVLVIEPSTQVFAINFDTW